MNKTRIHIALICFTIIGIPNLHAQDTARYEDSSKITETYKRIDQKQDSIINRYQSKLDSLKVTAKNYLDHTNDSLSQLQRRYLGKMNHSLHRFVKYQTQ